MPGEAVRKRPGAGQGREEAIRATLDRPPARGSTKRPRGHGAGDGRGTGCGVPPLPGQERDPAGRRDSGVAGEPLMRCPAYVFNRVECARWG